MDKQKKVTAAVYVVVLLISLLLLAVALLVPGLWIVWRVILGVFAGCWVLTAIIRLYDMLTGQKTTFSKQDLFSGGNSPLVSYIKVIAKKRTR